MNFEIIDNVFQVAVFFAAALGDMVYWFYKRDRLYIILALVHSCFMMGTLYFVLHLVIRGVVPQVFYVSEISWIASYLFMHTYQIVRIFYRIKKKYEAKKECGKEGQDCKDSFDMWSKTGVLIASCFLQAVLQSGKDMADGSYF